METDVFVATRDDVRRGKTPEYEANDLRVSVKGISPEEFAQLDFLVTGNDEREPRYVGGENEETCFFEFDDEFVAALAKLPPVEQARVADEWAGDLDGSMAEYLGRICALADRALRGNNHLFLCIST